MVVIRLARGGSKKRPFYNIVATDSATAVTVVSMNVSASTIRWHPVLLSVFPSMKLL